VWEIVTMKFSQFCSHRDLVEFDRHLTAFCEGMVEYGLTPADLDEFRLDEGHATSPNAVLLELRDFVNRLLGRKQAAAPADDLEPLTPVPHKDPRDFRAMPNRNLSRGDMYAQNAAVADQNKAADARNMERQKNALRGGAGERVMAMKQTMVDYARKMKDELVRKLGAQKDVVRQKNAGRPEAIDVADQFIDYVSKAAGQFEPHIDLSKHWGAAEPDLSGVKSGLQPQHLGAEKKGPFFSTPGQPGQYQANRYLGDQERGGKAADRAGFMDRVRKGL
jgi:hypothetical protein